MSHTKEPWHAGEQDFTGVDILCADELQIASVEIEEDARRIVACVNACAGISTDSLEQEGGAVMGWQRTARKLIDVTKQRDDLAEQVECATITRDNMEGRLNGCLVKYAAMKDDRDTWQRRAEFSYQERNKLEKNGYATRGRRTGKEAHAGLLERLRAEYGGRCR